MQHLKSMCFQTRCWTPPNDGYVLEVVIDWEAHTHTEGGGSVIGSSSGGGGGIQGK